MSEPLAVELKNEVGQGRGQGDRLVHPTRDAWRTRVFDDARARCVIDTPDVRPSNRAKQIRMDPLEVFLMCFTIQYLRKTFFTQWYACNGSDWMFFIFFSRWRYIQCSCPNTSCMTMSCVNIPIPLRSAVLLVSSGRLPPQYGASQCGAPWSPCSMSSWEAWSPSHGSG